MIRIKPVALFVLCVLTFVCCAHLPVPAKAPLQVALIQFQAGDETYLHPGNFETEVRIFEDACFEHGDPGLIVFPEYTCVFLALSPFAGLIQDKKTSAEAIQAIMSAGEITGVKSLFMSQSGFVEAEMKRIFGGMARRRGTTVIAGTFFAADGENLKNRAVIFGPDGEISYTQDKVFLTHMEKDMFRITPGDINRAVGFSCAGRKMVLTICRDSLEPVWAQRYGSQAFRDTNAWVDIKANGEVFTYAVEESFTQFMPARLAETGITYGLTSCLTGNFLEYFWEGESSIIRNTRGKPEVLQKSTNAIQAQILIETLE